jgi:hypothetical protein
MLPVTSVMSAVPVLFPLFVIDISAKSVTAVLFSVYCLSSYSLMYLSLQYKDVQLQLSDYACHHTISWIQLWWVSGFLHRAVLACVDLSCERTGSQLRQHPAEPGSVILKMEAQCSSETPGTNHYHTGGGGTPRNDRPSFEKQSPWSLNTYHCHPFMVLLSLLSSCCFSIRGVVLPLALLFSFLLWCSHYSRRVAFPFVLLSLSRCCSSCRCIFFLRFVVLFFFAVLLPLLIEISF